MATKHWTVFIVDNQVGIDYILSHGASALLSTRKSDRYSLVSNGNTSFNDNPFGYRDLKQWYSHIDQNTQKSNLTASFNAAIDNFSLKLKQKFGRVLVVATQDKNFDEFSYQEYTEFITSNDIKVTLVGVSSDGQWKPVIEEWKCSVVENPKETLRYNTKAQYTRPVKESAVLQFGRDVENLQNVAKMPAYADIPIEIYPAIKLATEKSTSQYKMESGEPRKFEISRKYFVKVFSETEDDGEPKGEFTPHYIDQGERLSAFKYSKFDLVVVTNELKAVATLDTVPSMDVLGFSPLSELPWPYIVGETKYVIPQMSPNLLDPLVTALKDLDNFAIVRWVQKAQANVHLAALLPTDFEISGHIKQGMILAPLAFSEDEKFGKFPWLTPAPTPKVEDSDQDSEEEEKLQQESRSTRFKDDTVTEPTRSGATKKFPDDQMKHLMDQYVSMFSFVEPEAHNFAVANTRVGLRESEPVTTSHIAGKSVSERLLATSPSAAKKQHYLREILVKSLSKTSINEFTSEENFAQNHLVDPEVSNLFSLENILEINTGTRGPIHRSPPPSLMKRLVERFDVQYHAPVEKAKPGEEQQSVEVNEGFAPYVDIDQLI